MSIFFYSGGMAQCRQMICDAGGIETEFPKGVDIFPHLIRNNLCLFIDEGYLDTRLMTPGMGLMSWSATPAAASLSEMCSGGRNSL